MWSAEGGVVIDAMEIGVYLAHRVSVVIASPTPEASAGRGRLHCKRCGNRVDSDTWSAVDLPLISWEGSKERVERANRFWDGYWGCYQALLCHSLLIKGKLGVWRLDLTSAEIENLGV